nr:ATP-binding domain-containing protein [Oscillospiraceae bacterium]
RFSALAGTLSVSELLSGLLDASGYELALRTEGSQERLDNLAELKQSVHDFEISCGEEADPQAYLAHVALYTAGDLDAKGDRVRLMTVHAAKGLEFPQVFLCGLNEGIFPSRRVMSLEAMEEERRLAFVALTRAEQGLWLSEAEGRNLDGSPRFPSRFLLDIAPENLVYDRAPADELLRGAWEYIERSAAFLPETQDDFLLPPGTRVRHSVFGPGTVLDADTGKGAHIIQFDGISTPRAVSFKAKLERI